MRLKQLHEFCDTQKENRRLSDVLLNDTQWVALDKILETLEPFFKYTMKLQSEHCTLSDFFGFWKSIEIKLGKMTHVLGQVLYNEMARKNTIMMENPTLLGAVYLDPRFQRALSIPQQQTAISFLATVHRKFEAIQDTSTVPDDTNNNEVGGDSSTDELLSFLDSCDQGVSAIPTNHPTIETLLKNFKNMKYPINRPAFEFWSKEKGNHPELYKIASAVFAIPPTQCSVERAFSAFANVLTSHRTKLSDSTLQNILLVKINKPIFDNIELEI